MEFTADIKFSNNLIENQETTITYSGYLFKNNSTSLKIVYGFGDNWMYTNEQEMEKTENGFIATVRMLNFKKFNFCFKNANNEWDNNYNSNFIAPISEFTVTEEFILNENTIEDICTNLVKYDISKIDESKTKNEEIGANIIKENIVEDTTFSEPDNIVIENTDSNDIVSFEAHIEENEAIDISETITNVTLESEINKDLNDEFTDIYEEYDSTSENIQEQANNLVSDLEIEKSSPIIENIQENNTEKFNINNFSELFQNFEEDEEISEKETNITNIDSIDDIKNIENNENETDITLDNESIEDDIITDNTNVNIIEDLSQTSNIITQDEYDQIDSIENFENIENNETVDNVVTDLIDDLYNNSKKATIHEAKDSQTLFKEIFAPVETDDDEEISDFEINDNEESLIENLNGEDEIEVKPARINIETTKVYKYSDEQALIVSPRALNPFYALKKKIKVAFYKIFKGLPKILSHNFDEEINE